MTFTPGTIEVDLTEGCWGHVNVCVGGNCGGVRRDTWSKPKSDTLCRNLGCGTTIASTEILGGKGLSVMVQSLHTTSLTANLNQSILVLSHRLIETPSKNSVAHVVCSGNVSMCTSSV